jgi:hypothetical protein
MTQPAPRQPKPFAGARAPLKPSVRTSTPTPDPFAIGRLGQWILLGRDALGKRALARCCGCGTVREIGLTDGVPSCGCGASRCRSAFAEVGHGYRQYRQEERGRRQRAKRSS